MAAKQGKTAFLFSGQGAQRPGMGRELYQISPAARAVFAAMDREMSTLCFFGTQEQLDMTIHTQPCVLTVDIAAARALIERGIEPHGCAGFSLGEVAALCIAGAFDDRTAFALIARRAEYMQAACDSRKGGMLAVIGGKAELVEELCAGIGDIWPVNYNCPGQLVVAGGEQALQRFLAVAPEHRLRTVPLRVSGAFHTEHMAPAAQNLAAVLGHMRFAPCALPVYGNTLATPYPDEVADIRTLLAQQLMKPVRWEDTVRNMVADGYTRFIECGPGDTLKGFFKRMKLDVSALTYQEALDGSEI